MKRVRTYLQQGSGELAIPELNLALSCYEQSTR